MKALVLCASMFLLAGAAASVQAACTPEEAQQKALAFSQVVQEMSQKDPQKYAKVMQELQPELLQLQQKQDLEALCTFYDKAMDELK